MKIKIYSKLSLRSEKKTKFSFDYELRPPIKRYDLVQDLKDGVNVVGIVDGEFLQSLAVSPYEILEVMRSGVRVYGASSMGALRAAELEIYGMIGCGSMFQYLKQRPYFKDDALGQIYLDEDNKHLSIPLLDFSMAVDRLVSSKQINAKVGHRLVAIFAGLHFSDRNINHLRNLIISSRENNASKLLSNLETLEKNMVSQKHLDSLEMMRRIQVDLAEIAKGNQLLNT